MPTVGARMRRRKKRVKRQWLLRMSRSARRKSPAQCMPGRQPKKRPQELPRRKQRKANDRPESWQRKVESLRKSLALARSLKRKHAKHQRVARERRNQRREPNGVNRLRPG